MKLITNIILPSILCTAFASAHAVVFEAYSDTLIDDLMCADYPKINLKMHLQMLRDTGAISPKATGVTIGNSRAYKVNPGFELFGFPLEFVHFSGATYGSIEVYVKGTFDAVAKSVQLSSQGRKYRFSKLDGYNLSGYVDEEKGFEVGIADSKYDKKLAKGLVGIGCFKYVP